MRLRRKRKPQTLQRFWQERLQPWLDFANLLPFAGGGDWFEPLGKDEPAAHKRVEAQKDQLQAEFVERFGQESRREGSATILQSLAHRVAQNYRVNELVSTFVEVRRLFESLPAMGCPSEPLTARSVEEYKEVPFPMDYWVRDS